MTPLSMSSIDYIPVESSIDDMRVRTPRELGAVIKGRRLDLRLDQAALAERVGVSRQWIIAVERGKPRADMTLVLRTFEALGMRLDATAEDAEQRLVHGAAFPDIDAIVDAARRPSPTPTPTPTPARPKPKPKPRRA